MSEFESPALDRRIDARARACGLTLTDEALARLAEHVRLVLRFNEELHLTTITEPEELLERHLGESFEGAALIPGDRTGTLLDLGSGNGYPGVAIANARPGLAAVLTEASRRKAAFLRHVVAASVPGGDVFEGQVQRAPDLRDLTVDVLATRAMGAWEKIVPRMHAALTPGADVLVWAGADVEPVFRRTVWRRFELVARRDLPGRESSTIWHLRPVPRV
jgi:16S rRNA (guanine527-N7)-methyltransferase